MRPLAPLLRFLVIVLLLAAPSGARAQLSEADRKAAARSAYTEGVKLQEDGKPAEALARFEAAEKLFDAPTHLIRIAQCQAATGKLVESQETYEVLIHKNLGANPPEAFIDAQKKAEGELKDLKTRIPTLRLTVKPDPQTLKNLQVTVNGAPMPNELLSIARPVNPGPYKLNASATGYKLAAPVDITLAEKDQKSVELSLVPGQAPAVVVAPPPPAPAPPPYTTGNPPPPPPPYQATPAGAEQQPAPQPKPGSSPYGLLLGLHFGVAIPGGGLTGGNTTTVGTITTTRDFNFNDYSTAGAGGGLDASFRFARMLFAGLSFDYASFGKPDSTTIGTQTVQLDVKSHSTYVGVLLGIVPNIDRTSFIGSIGVGRRSYSLQSNNTTAANALDLSLSGTDFALDAGISIPAGPIRLVPKAAVTVGAFSSGDVTIGNSKTSGDVQQTATHTIFTVALAGFWNLDLGKK